MPEKDQNIQDYEEIEYDEVKTQNVKNFVGHKLKLYTQGIQIRELPDWTAATFTVDVYDAKKELLIDGIEVFTNSAPLVTELKRMHANPKLAGKMAKIKVELNEYEGKQGNFLMFTDWS